MKPRTLFQKIWDNHVVHQEAGRQAILYVDLHLVHEVTSPQAFEGLRLAETSGSKTRADGCHGRSQCADQRPESSNT